MEISCVHFLGNFVVDIDSMLPQHLGLLKIMLNLFCASNIQVYSNLRILLICYHCPVLGHLVAHLFQTLCDAKHNQTVQCNSSLNDLDIHPRSQGYGKARSCAVILL